MSHVDTLSANDLLIECIFELEKRHPNEFPALNYLMHRIGFGGLEKLERKAKAFDEFASFFVSGNCIQVDRVLIKQPELSEETRNTLLEAIEAAMEADND